MEGGENAMDSIKREAKAMAADRLFVMAPVLAVVCVIVLMQTLLCQDMLTCVCKR